MQQGHDKFVENHWPCTILQIVVLGSRHQLLTPRTANRHSSNKNEYLINPA